jgi:hypothetical protein
MGYCQHDPSFIFMWREALSATSIIVGCTKDVTVRLEYVVAYSHTSG